MWVLIIQSSNETRREHVLKTGRSALGRRMTNDIVLQDASASGQHAEIYYDPAGDLLTIRDLDSTNGTFVNGKRIHDPCELHHEDHIRIGLCFITVISAVAPTAGRSAVSPSHTKVTSQLLLESAENYGALLHEIAQRLVSIPDLDRALFETTELIKRMVGAEDCRIILADHFSELEDSGIPASVVQTMVHNQSAGIFALDPERSSAPVGEPVQGPQSLLLVPVLIEGTVAALILSRRVGHPSSTFYDSDLQLVLAVSNQIAMSIQRHRIQGKLLHTSNHDGLTDLPNRNLFLERVREAIARARRHEETGFAILFFDIDNFKNVNDSLGHLVGDRLLIAIADRLRRNVRDIDTVARASIISRFGGDEFAILLDDILDHEAALAAATRLQELMSHPYEIDGKEMFATASMGVALSSKDYTQPEEILRDADIAMYRAKELGKERIEVYDKAMHAHVLRRMRISTALRQGALQKEFRLHYQPIVSLKNGRISGHEALLRWYTASGDLLAPADFMDAIDTAGLLYTTDQWVLQNACRQAVEWLGQFPGDPPLFMSVNISAKYFRHPNLVTNIKEVLHTTGLDPARLWLEITESVSAADDESAISVLRSLHDLGVHISLDDFGTGYSALNYLAHFPVDALKIDRSFISRIGLQDESSRIVEMIKALANQLGLILIAEGVENARQLAFLYSMGCDYVQGYFLARPMDAAAATQALAEGPRWRNQLAA